ncbi:MAG: hypothetical protein R3Y64_09630 [Peptostreptococcaceae bacterium]
MNLTLGKMNTKLIALAFMTMVVAMLSFGDAFAIDNFNIQMGADGKLTGGLDNSDSGAEVWTNILGEYQQIIVGVSGIATITMVAVFIMNFMKLGTTSTNPSERQKVTNGLLWSGMAAAGLGSVTMIVGFFMNSLS